MSGDEFTGWVRSPVARDTTGGDERVGVVVVRGDIDDGLPAPGSLPAVVCWVGDRFGGRGPRAADVVVGDDDLDGLIERIGGAPLAAASLAILLRATDGVDVEAGLAMESATYSMLQAGPEFASWRLDSIARAFADDEQPVDVDRHDGELVITLNRPHRHNAITARLRDELCAALTVAIADPSIGVVTLRGNGPSFCSGGDLDEFGSRPDPVTAHITRLVRSPALLLHHLRRRLHVHVHGATHGGGMEIAAFADRVTAAAGTDFRLPEIELGLIPGAGGTVSVTRRIGRQRTAALALSGRSIDAATALDWGLVDAIEADPR